MTISLSSTGFSSFAAGDCFVYTFQTIQPYQAVDASMYKPVKNALTTCSLSPSATCERVSDYQFRIRLTAAGSPVTGTVGPFINPFSTYQLRINDISLYRGCVASTPDETSITTPYATIQKAEMTSATVTGVETTVGADDEDNIATFTFSPATVLSSHGGEIVITAPDWYSATSPALQAYGSTVQNMCSSDFLTISAQTTARSSFYSGSTVIYLFSYEITYTALGTSASASGNATKSVTISCKNWRNPITPTEATGFRIT